MERVLDKSWMYIDRRLQEYEAGVDEFMKFALLNANGHDMLRCPCVRCVNYNCLPSRERNLDRNNCVQPRSQTDFPPSVPPNLKVTSHPCRLALGSIDRVVAEGEVFHNEGPSVLHGIPLGEDNARVSIHTLLNAKCGIEPIPFAIEDASTLLEAIGNFVAWPKHLIIRNEIPMSKVKPPSKLAYIESVIESFSELVNVATSKNVSLAIDVEVNPHVFRTDDPFHEPVSHIPLVRSDMYDLIFFKEVGASIMKVYMCYLHDKAKEWGVEGFFRFVEPAGVRGYSGGYNKQQLFKTLDSGEINKEYMFFYPYNIGYHWVLAIIVPTKRHMYYFNPLGNDVDVNVREIFAYACKFLDHGFKFAATKKKNQLRKKLCVPCNKERLSADIMLCAI